MTVNTVDLQIFGIPVYFFCAIIGLVITICVYIALISEKKYDISQSVKILFLSLFGMIVGCKIFGFLTGVYRCIGNKQKVTFDAILDTGIVFYGGLFGLIIVYSICLKSKKCIVDKNAIDVIAVCIPLFHSIARIGCFFSGCCYGKEYVEPLAIKYITIIENEINESLRFPIQLVEALFEFLLFWYLLTLLHNERWQEKKILVRYLIFYSIARFMFEYLRGDVRRGLICGISFSQGISILIWVNLGFLYLRRYIISKQKGGV